jgi:hypothetical protein
MLTYGVEASAVIEDSVLELNTHAGLAVHTHTHTHSLTLSHTHSHSHSYTRDAGIHTHTHTHKHRHTRIMHITHAYIQVESGGSLMADGVSAWRNAAEGVLARCFCTSKASL